MLEELQALARNGLREIAVRGLASRGLRMDAVFYLLDAMRLFRGSSYLAVFHSARAVLFRVGMREKSHCCIGLYRYRSVFAFIWETSDSILINLPSRFSFRSTRSS